MNLSLFVQCFDVWNLSIIVNLLIVFLCSFIKIHVCFIITKQSLVLH